MSRCGASTFWLTPSPSSGNSFAHYIVRSETIGVLRFEIPFPNNPVRVDMHTIVGDNLRLRIGQQRKLDLVPVCKVLQDFRAVIADCGQLNSLCFEFLFCALQLHELRFAEGSPVRRTEEQKHRSVCPFQRIAGYVFAKLVAGRKGWHLLAHVRPSQGRSQARGGRLIQPTTKR